MKTFTISLVGCDETTCFDLDLTDEQVALVDRMAAASRQASEYGCFPTLTIDPKAGS